MREYYLKNSITYSNKEITLSKNVIGFLITKNNPNKNRREIDVNFRLIDNARHKIHHTLKDKSKSASTFGILGIDIQTYRKWIIFQVIPDTNCRNFDIDLVKPISSFDVFNDEGLMKFSNGSKLSWIKNFIFKKVKNLVCLKIHCSLLKLINSLNQI